MCREEGSLKGNKERKDYFILLSGVENLLRMHVGEKLRIIPVKFEPHSLDIYKSLVFLTNCFLLHITIKYDRP